MALYRVLRRRFAAAGVEVIMVEHRGVGLSRHDDDGVDLPPAALTVEAAVDDLAAVLDDADVRLVGLEAAGDGVDTPFHAATITMGRPGVLHGAKSLMLQDADGQTMESHSISAGLDYPGVGPEHAWLAEIGRAEYRGVTDAQAMDALRLLSRTEGIIPAIETAHGLHGALELGRELRER